jgi:hypothetical protein
MMFILSHIAAESPAPKSSARISLLTSSGKATGYRAPPLDSYSSEDEDSWKRGGDELIHRLPAGQQTRGFCEGKSKQQVLTYIVSFSKDFKSF